MSLFEHLSPLWLLLGYIILGIITAFSAVFIPKIKKDIEENIPKFNIIKPKPLRNYFSDRLNKSFDSAVMLARCGAKADRCFVYIHHHYKMSMTHENVGVGFKSLFKHRQNIELMENGKSLQFLRDVSVIPNRGVQEINVVRDAYKEEDERHRLSGEREVVYLCRSGMRRESIPSLLMRESNTAHVLLAPIMSKHIGLPFREFKEMDSNPDRTNKIIGVIGLDYVQKNINLEKLFDQYAFVLAEVAQTLHTFMEVEILHTNIKKRLE